MRNRIIAMLLVVALIPTLLAVPARAADSFSDYFDVLDYTFPTGGSPSFDNSNLKEITPDNNVISFNLPDFMGFYYIDIVLIIGGSIPSYISIFYGGTSSLIISHLGDNIYRVYGSLQGHGSNYFSLTFNVDSTSYLTFKSVRLYTEASNSFSVGANFEANLGDIDLSFSYSPGGLGVSDSVVFENPQSVPTFASFVYGDDWLNFDYIDILLTYHVSEISSITAVAGDSFIPFTVSYLNDTSLSISSQYISIRLDLTGLDKRSDIPMIIIGGSAGYGVNMFGVLSCVGYITKDIDPLFYYFNSLKSWISNLGSSIGSWFQQQIAAVSTWGQNIVNSISTWGQNIVNALNPDSSDADNAVSDSKDKSNQIGNLTGQMGSMQKPDISGSGNISSIISPGDVTSYTTFLSTVVNAPFISQVVTLSLIFSLAAYVLFGKR